MQIGDTEITVCGGHAKACGQRKPLDIRKRFDSIGFDTQLVRYQRGFSIEWMSAREEFVDNTTQGIDIVAEFENAAFQSIATSVRRCNRARRHTGWFVVRTDFIAVPRYKPCQTEVHDFRLVTGRQEDIAGLEIAVNHTAGMDVCKSTTHPGNDSHHAIDWYGFRMLSREYGAQGLTMQQFHGKKANGTVWMKIVNTDDIWM
jgi:hypothetical protein